MDSQNLQRRASSKRSRPQSLALEQTPSDWHHDLVLDEQSSPAASTDSTTSTTSSSLQNGTPPDHLPTPLMSSNKSAMLAAEPSPRNLRLSTAVAPHSSHLHPHQPHHTVYQALKSPCFVHSLLEKGASFSDWLHRSQHNRQTSTADVPAPVPYQAESHPRLPSRTPTQLHPATTNRLTEPSPPSDLEDFKDGDEEEDSSSSLTRQLAETAVGVRELSKQLGEREFYFVGRVERNFIVHCHNQAARAFGQISRAS